MKKVVAGSTVTLIPQGRLDTLTAPLFEAAIDEVLPDTAELILDFGELSYISSAGLRVILKAQKIMNTKGNMKLTHVNDSIMEILDITGFVDILTIE